MKQNILLGGLFLIFSVLGRSQPAFERVDSVAKAFVSQHTDARQLARELTALFSEPVDKARAIFTWIAHNIRYDCKKFHDKDRDVAISGYSEEDAQRKYLKFREKQLVETLRKRKGICDDYSHLFQAMCEAIGIEAVVISGTSRRFESPFRRLPERADHAWNAFRINDQWHLVDVTWAAGYTDEEVKRFTFEFRPGYFMVPPRYFLLDHFPQEEKWQLVEKPLSRKDFPKQPVICYGTALFTLTDFTPTLLSVSDNQVELRLRFEGEAPTRFFIAPKGGKPEPVSIIQKGEDGWLTLRFPRPKDQEVVVLVEKVNSNTWQEFARYPSR